jgi:hypothetical protein
MLRLPTEYYVGRSYLQGVDVVAVRTVTFVEDDRLEIDLRSAIGGMNASDRHQEL